MQFVPAYWMEMSNLGDALTPFIIEKITGKKAYHVSPQEDVRKFVITGSILNWDIKSAVVWGAGCANASDIIPPNKEIWAVRGALTGDMCRRQGVPFREVYGDPAILLPKLFHTEHIMADDFKKKIGVIPHYVDQHSAISRFNDWGNDVLFIDILGSLDNFIEQISQCKIVYSSTLHGVIICHAYGIPCYWTKFADYILGDDIKYYDHYTSLYVPVADVKPLDLRRFSVIDYRSLPTTPLIPNSDTIKYVQDKLLENCPLYEI